MTKPARIFHPSDVLVGLLRVKYAAPAYALFEQVASGVGFGSHRNADAIAVAIWPSRGLEILGFECKSSRSDWKRELDNPEKADPIAQFCDRWFIVAGGDGIVKEGELPPTWGLLEANAEGKMLLCRHEAPKLDPKPLSREFVAAILRRAHQGQEALVRIAKQKGIEEGIAQAPARQDNDVALLRHQLTNLETSVAGFQEASGLEINSYNGPHLGEAVKLVQSRYFRAPAQLRRLQENMQHMADELGKDVTIAERLVGATPASEGGAVSS